MARPVGRRRRIGTLHRLSSYWNQETIKQSALYALDSHGAETPRNPLKNHRPTDAHRAAFYPAISQECRSKLSKAKALRESVARGGIKWGAAPALPNQCADKGNSRNPANVVPVSSILPPTIPASLAYSARSRWDRECGPNRPLSAWKALTGTAAGGQGWRVSATAQRFGLEGLTTLRSPHQKQANGHSHRRKHVSRTAVLCRAMAQATHDSDDENTGALQCGCKSSTGNWCVRRQRYDGTFTGRDLH